MILTTKAGSDKVAVWKIATKYQILQDIDGKLTNINRTIVDQNISVWDVCINHSLAYRIRYLERHEVENTFVYTMDVFGNLDI